VTSKWSTGEKSSAHYNVSTIVDAGYYIAGCGLQDLPGDASSTYLPNYETLCLMV